MSLIMQVIILFSRPQYLIGCHLFSNVYVVHPNTRDKTLRKKTMLGLVRGHQVLTSPTSDQRNQRNKPSLLLTFQDQKAHPPIHSSHHCVIGFMTGPKTQFIKPKLHQILYTSYVFSVYFMDWKTFPTSQIKERQGSKIPTNCSADISPT